MKTKYNTARRAAILLSTLASTAGLLAYLTTGREHHLAFSLLWAILALANYRIRF